MNNWDKVFWMLFVLLQFAIIVTNIWFYNPVGFIVGLVLIVAGFAKLGSDIAHKKVRQDVLENKDSIKKMTNWLNRQYELTKGIKEIHERRFHRMDKKRMELEEDFEKSLREIAGKMIDIENRLSLISRALVAQRSLEGAHKSAEAVWRDLTALAGSRKSITTLSRGIRNRILDVRSDRIVLRSDLTKKERHVLKDEFRHFWEILNSRKKLHFPQDIKDPKMVRAGSIIISFLARLPYIEHSVKPRVLYFTGRDTHSLGTLKTYAKTI